MDARRCELSFGGRNTRLAVQERARFHPAEESKASFEVRGRVASYLAGSEPVGLLRELPSQEPIKAECAQGSGVAEACLDRRVAQVPARAAPASDRRLSEAAEEVHQGEGRQVRGVIVD